jgi:hypothetical protein
VPIVGVAEPYQQRVRISGRPLGITNSRIPRQQMEHEVANRTSGCRCRQCDGAYL